MCRDERNPLGNADVIFAFFARVGNGFPLFSVRLYRVFHLFPAPRWEKGNVGLALKLGKCAPLRMNPEGCVYSTVVGSWIGISVLGEPELPSSG